MQRWLVYGAVVLLVAVIGLAGWQVGGNEVPQATPAPPQPTRALTPRLPSNATSRVTPTNTPLAAAPTATSATADALPPLPTLPPLAPDVPEPLPPLVFSRQGQIWLSDGSDASPQQLTSFGEGIYAGQPAVSPDGQQVAFVALVASQVTDTLELPSSALFVMNRDGSELREVWAPKERILWLPAWTPDAQAIYLLANGSLSAATEEGGLRALQVVRFDLATGQEQPIVSGALDPALSRDGRQLAYLKFDDEGVVMHLEVAGPDGANPRRVIDGTPFLGFFAPRFTPDGTQIVVAGIEGPETDEQGYPIRSAGGGFLDGVLGLFEPPAAQAHGAPWDMWIVNVDGSGLRRLTYFYEDQPMAAFAPDGSEMVIMGYNGFYRMNRDGSNLRRINPDGDHGGVDWLPKAKEKP
jgi:Tol biopolymer transport system component